MAEMGLERAPMSHDELLDLVRIRLRRGFDPGKLPLLLESELALPPDAVREAVAAVQRELERRASIRMWRRLGLTGAGVLALLALWQASEGSRGLSLALVVAAVGAGLGLVSWLLSELLTGRD